jgi:hypothetical protein
MDAKRILRDASPEQMRWVMARLNTTTDADAARIAGVHPVTVCRWENKAQLDEAVRLLLSDAVEHAAEVLREAAPAAARALTDAVRDKRQRVQAATAILDRVGLSTTQKHELSGPSGAPLLDLQAMVEALRQADEALSGSNDEG